MRLGFQLALEQFERLAQPEVDDAVERLALDLAPGETRFRRQVDRFAGQAVAENGAALVDFQAFGAADRNAQPHADVVGEMVAADGRTRRSA